MSFVLVSSLSSVSYHNRKYNMILFFFFSIFGLIWCTLLKLFIIINNNFSNIKQNWNYVCNMCKYKYMFVFVWRRRLRPSIRNDRCIHVLSLNNGADSAVLRRFVQITVAMEHMPRRMGPWVFGTVDAFRHRSKYVHRVNAECVSERKSVVRWIVLYVRWSVWFLPIPDLKTYYFVVVFIVFFFNCVFLSKHKLLSYGLILYFICILEH